MGKSQPNLEQEAEGRVFFGVAGYRRRRRIADPGALIEAIRPFQFERFDLGVENRSQIRCGRRCPCHIAGVLVFFFVFVLLLSISFLWCCFVYSFGAPSHPVSPCSHASSPILIAISSPPLPAPSLRRTATPLLPAMGQPVSQ